MAFYVVKFIYEIFIDFGGENVLVLCINHAAGWVQITTGGRTYTCPMKDVNGELFFRFKNEWHRVTDYTSEYTSHFGG